MKTKLLACLLAGLLSSCVAHRPPGCPAPSAASDTNQASACDGLLVLISSNRTHLATGEEMHVKVSVINEGSRPITIPATSSTLVSLHLQRGDAGGWAEVRRYPQMSLAVLSPWTLQPRAWRTFEFNLKAEPDWSTGEPTRLVARISGRPDAVPFLKLSISIPR